MKFRFKDPTINYLLLILVVLAVGFELFLPGRKFLNIANFQSMAFQVPELGILAIAMMITMLSGGINLSIIATANMTAITTAYILTRFIEEGATGVGPVFVMIVAVSTGLLIALLVGLVNGIIIAYVGVSPILATLGTMTLIEGLNVALTRGDVISGFPKPILFIGNGVVLGIPMPILIFVACALVVALFLNRTPFGVSVYMMGSNEKATLFSGIQTKKVLLKIYALSGFLCGLSAIIMISRFNSANAAYASSYLLVTILASVLGGVNPDGGFGKVLGLVLSLIVLQVISSGLNLLGFSAHLTIALWGVILIVVISLHHLRAWIGRAEA
jgi:ribose/xylose/arabinose/galactoside ABC-type transport system permease subunit